MPYKDNGDKKFKIQMIPVTLVGLLTSAINGIVAYIAVYFFKPLWDKLVRWWNNESSS
jgi:cobalamin synthase